MSEFSDKPIIQGVRKNTEYTDALRARLALEIPRADGGILRIPVLTDVKAANERENIQRNTLISVVPMARLPGYEKLPHYPVGALPRPGRVYVFRQNVLWRELVTDGAGKLFEVDVANWREVASRGGDASQRCPVGMEQHLILLPMLLQGRFVGDQLCMAYSEVTWSWEYIEWLETEPSRVKARCQNIGRAWYTAVGASQEWTTTQDNPSMPVSMIRTGLRARDFNIECALEDPLSFTPAFSGFEATSMAANLQSRQEQLAEYLKHEPPPPLPPIEPSPDLLAEYNLRDNRHLVGIFLDDPIFGVRHAAAQIRHGVAYLQTLNALTPYLPHGQYAQLLYSVAASQFSLKNEIDWPSLHGAVFERGRRTCRTHLTTQMSRLVHLLNSQLPTALRDWTYRTDESSLEPYAIITEALIAIERMPGQADAMYAGEDSEKLADSINTLIQNILSGKHILGAMLFALDANQSPLLLQQAKGLRDSDRVPDPSLMGISTLLIGEEFFGSPDTAGMAKNLSFFVGDVLDNLTNTALAHIIRLSTIYASVKFNTLITPTFNTLSKLSNKMKDVELITHKQAIDKNYIIIGLKGEGLRNGLTDSERAGLAHSNYRYGASKALTTNLTSTEARILALPKGNDELDRYTAFRSQHQSSRQIPNKSKTVPTLMVMFAIYNLTLQAHAYKEIEASGEDGRALAGLFSAATDVAAALGAHSQLLFGLYPNNFLSYPRFEVTKISKLWASSLEICTGSSKLSILRGLGGFATLLGAAVSAWDAYRAFRDGSYSLAASYIVMSAGSGLWGAYAMGFLANPIALLVGAALTIGALVAASLLADSDLEVIVRHGPFGVQFDPAESPDSVTFPHLKLPHAAYQQLVGALGRPKVNLFRLSEWRQNAPSNQLKLVMDADRLREIVTDTRLRTIKPDKQPLVDDDWVVILSSPLISMFTNHPRPQMFGQEFQSTLGTNYAFAARQYRRLPTPTPKISAIPVDASSLLYIVPAAYKRPMLSLRDRHNVNMTVGLRISTQIELRTSPDGPALILPQPSPKQWKAFDTTHRRVPSDTALVDTPPLYWQVETLEFPV